MALLMRFYPLSCGASSAMNDSHDVLYDVIYTMVKHRIMTSTLKKKVRPSKTKAKLQKEFFD